MIPQDKFENLVRFLLDDFGIPRTDESEAKILSRLKSAATPRGRRLVKQPCPHTTAISSHHHDTHGPHSRVGPMEPLNVGHGCHDDAKKSPMRAD